MSMLKISVELHHKERSPHDQVQIALKLLNHVRMIATPEEPALGGALRDETGEIVGSYMVEFGDLIR